MRSNRPIGLVDRNRVLFDGIQNRQPLGRSIRLRKSGSMAAAESPETLTVVARHLPPHLANSVLVRAFLTAVERDRLQYGCRGLDAQLGQLPVTTLYPAWHAGAIIRQ